MDEYEFGNEEGAGQGDRVRVGEEAFSPTQSHFMTILWHLLCFRLLLGVGEFLGVCIAFDAARENGKGDGGRVEFPDAVEEAGGPGKGNSCSEAIGGHEDAADELWWQC